MKMVFRQWDRGVSKSVPCPLSIKPGRSDEPGNRAADSVFDNIASFGNSACGLRAGQAEKFAFSGGHEAGTEPIGSGLVIPVVAMVIAVKEHFDAMIGPVPEALCKCRTRNDWRIAPVIWNDQHRNLRTDVFSKHIDKRPYLGFEARRDVMNRRK